MDLNSTENSILQKETWQGRIVYNQSQKDILQEWFKQNPYPDRATRKQWAKEIGIPEAKIQIWFKNHRSKQRQLEFGRSLGKDETQGQHHHQPWTQEYLPKAARQDWTSITRSQSHVLLQAFERNRFLDITTRKKLAKKTGIQEPRIQMWFQNQRSLYPQQSRNESVNSLADGPNGRPGLTAQQHQINLSTPLGRSHHFASSILSAGQTFLPAPLPSYESSVPCVSQEPSVMMVQPMQAMQRGENSVSPQTLRNHLPIPSTSGGDLSDTPTPFWLPNQEKCQNHEEQTGTGVLQLKGYCEPHPEHQEDQLQDLQQVDIPYILQRWDEVCQALTAKWDPREGTH
ncbi:LOW QUALITY PROTEIN: double homeobox protein B [Neomonachus schauinslandi]|uniref:LOW QUALITY PROTEIN: double homeobox protein B n=1 Tax=Neomonachus schauinslandi TaxID=29088 RepID=A0A2Y9II52_NEOSC|nr:LOW QUALITY PROTEIN: double homeobox protein B [Neomonachus schauinslandi]